MIYDLLLKNSGALELREDPDQGVCVAGLKRIQVRMQRVLHAHASPSAPMRAHAAACLVP